MFANTLASVEECGLTWLHVFRYSARAGTPAARMPQVSVALRKERAARLRDAGKAAVARYLDAQVGRHAMVLVEQPGLGRTEGFAEVDADAGVPAGQLARVLLTGHDGERLKGRVEL